MTAAAVNERKPGGSRGMSHTGNRATSPSISGCSSRAGSFSRRCFLNQYTGWAPQQSLAALPSPGHLSVDVFAGFLQFLASLTEQSLPIPDENLKGFLHMSHLEYRNGKGWPNQ